MKCSAQCTPLKAGWGFMGSFTHQRQCLCRAIFRWSGIYDFPEYLECEWVMWAPSVSLSEPQCSLSTVIMHYCSHNANRSWRNDAGEDGSPGYEVVASYLKWNETHWCNHKAGKKCFYFICTEPEVVHLKNCLNVKIKCNRTKWTKSKKPFPKSLTCENFNPAHIMRWFNMEDVVKHKCWIFSLRPWTHLQYILSL